MVNQFLKTFLIGFISGSLIFNPVMAQSSSKTVVETDAEGNKYAKTTHQLSGNQSNDMIASLTGIAIGAIASRMLLHYKTIGATDIMVAAAGGAAFIAGEVMSNMGAKKDLDKQTLEVIQRKGQQDQAQIELIQQLKTSYENAKKTSKTKKTMQMAATAAFAGAAAMALYASMNEVAGDVRCYAAANMARAPLATCAATSATANPDAPACGACLAQIDPYLAAYKAAEAKRSAPANSLATASADKAAQGPLLSGVCKTAVGTSKGLIAAADAACSQAIIYKQSQTAAGKPVAVSSIINHILFPAQKITYDEMQSREFYSESTIEKFMNILFPSAHAGWMPMLGLGAGAAASYFLISGPLAVQIDSMMYVARNRAIMWGGLAALSFLSMQATANQIKKIDENIAKLDQILKELQALEKGTPTGTINTQGIAMQVVDPNTIDSQNFSVDNTTKSPCMTSNATEGCKSVAEQLEKTQGFTQLPPAFQTLATDAAKMADGLSGTKGMSGAAMTSANSLAGKQNAVNKLLKKTQGKFNQIAKKNGKGAIDFDKASGDFLRGAAASVKKSLMKGGVSASGMMASIGGAPINSADLGKPIPEETSKGEAALPGVVGSSGVTPDPKADEDKMDLAFDEAPGAALADAGAAAGAEEAQYEINGDEIHKDTGPSIFEVISSRYLKSGYSKLLEEEPAPAAKN